jgi:hypothetical protein
MGLNLRQLLRASWRRQIPGKQERTKRISGLRPLFAGDSIPRPHRPRPICSLPRRHLCAPCSRMPRTSSSGLSVRSTRGRSRCASVAERRGDRRFCPRIRLSPPWAAALREAESIASARRGWRTEAIASASADIPAECAELAHAGMRCLCAYACAVLFLRFQTNGCEDRRLGVCLRQRRGTR